MFHTVIYRSQSSRQKKPITENQAYMHAQYIPQPQQKEKKNR